MKTLVLVSLAVLLPCLSFGQSNADYEQTMGKIMQFYNRREIDSLRSLLAHKSELESHGKWDMDDFHDNWGEIISYKQTLVYNGLATFEVNFTGGCWYTATTVSLTTFSLDKNNKVFNFSLIGAWR